MKRLKGDAMKAPPTTADDKRRYFFEVYGDADLRADWAGWRIRGRYLITPNRDRIGPEQLAALIYFQQLREKRAAKEVGRDVLVSSIEQFRQNAQIALASAAKR